MALYEVKKIRNIALCGHGSVGKTTLLDRLLNFTGAVNRPASVDDGTSICDFDEEEKSHRYTIEAKVTFFDYDGLHYHVIDTPGYRDFIGQVIGAFRAVDLAAIVINAQSGVEVNTRRVFQEAEKAGIPRLIIINKLDAENIDFENLLAGIRETFGDRCVPLNVPIGLGADFRGVATTLKAESSVPGAVIDPSSISQSLMESIVVADEEVLSRYFEGQMPTDEEISQLLGRAMIDGSVIPIVCVSAKTGVGLPELLKVFDLCGISPDRIVRRAQKPDSGEWVELTADPSGPLVAQVFKTRVDPFVQKISFLRAYSGTVRTNATVSVVGERKGLKLAQLFHVQASEMIPIEEAGPGAIVAVTKVEELKTGMSIGDLVMPPIEFPTPMTGLAITPKSRGDEQRLSGALAKICQEDPTCRLDRDPQTKELVITGMSELHLQVIRERLKRRDKVEVDVKEPKIPYRETIQAPAEGMYRHKKQTGGRGQFGEVHIRMFPFPRGTKVEEFATKERFPEMKEVHYHEESNFLWIDSIVGGTIPSNFMPAVEKGFLERISRGVIAGYPVQDVCVEVFFGKHHPVDSSEQAFKTAASMVFRNVFQQAKPALLEPIVKIEVTVPADKVGDINSDLSGRRGRVLGMTSAGGGFQTIVAEVPLAEVITYARALSSITGGQGSYTLEFSHYDIVPGNIQKEIIEKAKLEEEEEE
ncbi:MAG TPA: elongation factor G [Thermogutta sp.]|nr:elongation factor G [Thermogutta sp.]HPU05510.1 elongation factor G [Thermogutta sp.]HQF12450.1 elongation factor G [Thermogutta sp.]